MKTIDLDLSRTFIEFALCGSVNETASKLSLSQPAVSTQLKRFEDQFPFAIFTFQGKRKVLTRYGKDIFYSLQGTFEKLDENLRKISSSYEKAENLKLRIGLRRELIASVLKRASFKGVLEFKNLTGDQMFDSLDKREIDIAITQRKPQGRGYGARKVLSNGTHLMVHKKWLPPGIHSAEQLRNKEFIEEVPFLAYSDPPPFIGEWLSNTTLDESLFKTHVICDYWTLIAQMVSEGRGFSIVPTSIRVDSPYVKVFPIPQDTIKPVSFYAYFNPEILRIPSFKNYINLLVKN